MCRKNKSLCCSIVWWISSSISVISFESFRHLSNILWCELRCHMRWSRRDETGTDGPYLAGLLARDQGAGRYTGSAASINGCFDLQPRLPRIEDSLNEKFGEENITDGGGEAIRKVWPNLQRRALSVQSVMQHYASFVGSRDENTKQVRLELQKSDNGCWGTVAGNTAPWVWGQFWW